MNLTRKSGVLLHLSSLPNKFGIGDLGTSAYHFIDFLAQSKQSLWQILPLNPTEFLDSPYAPYSAFAGNPYLISPEKLQADQLIDSSHINLSSSNPAGWKQDLLKHAHQTFIKSRSTIMAAEYHAFCSTNQFWLDDYGLFMALKSAMDNTAWVTWPNEISNRQPKALLNLKKKLASTIEFQKFIQFIFYRQWRQLRAYAHKKKITIIGDLPLFVAHDSADVWANQEFFHLQNNGLPAAVAGVPPDYFSATGQLWGNPLYNWEVHRQTNYNWWIKRFTNLLKYVDLIRIDHFRGFESYWEIPHDEKTAVKGRWKPGPGSHFFASLKEELGYLPMIAEDLGFIDQKVTDLREQWSLPSMRVLQFGFEGLKDNIHSPHAHTKNSVVYTGTHDNNTTLGWYRSASPEIQDYTRRYLGTDGSDIAWDLIRAALSSPAAMAIIPLQDILSLDSEARMNTPGTVGKNNWQWRYNSKTLTDQISNRLADLTLLYGR